MKHVLLGSTALVATALLAGGAEANVQLGLGGYYAAAAGIDFSQDDEAGEPGFNTSSDVFRQDVEVYFKGEVTLDNGLAVGATIQLEGQQSGDQIDEVWAYFKGGWGELRFGDDDDVYEQLAYLIPSASNIFGVDTPYFEFANNFGGGGAWAQTNNTIRRLSGDATKIMYFSPNFGGFTFAASWAPDRRGEDTYSGFTGAAGGFGGGGTTGNNNPGQVDDIFAAAANFEHDFNGVNLVLGIGGGHANWEATAAGQDEDAWLARGHAIVSFAGFTIGVAGEYISNFQSSNATGPDTWSAGVGATYNWDVWTVGLAWSHGRYESFDNAHDTDQLDIVAITGRYDLGPGISLDGMVGYNHYDSNTSNAGGFSSSNETWEAGIGFYIGF
jgi:hypothetical protein